MLKLPLSRPPGPSGMDLADLPSSLQILSLGFQSPASRLRPDSCQPLRRVPPSNDRSISCLAPPLRSGAKQLGASSTSRASVVQPEPAWCLRYAPDTNLAFAGSGASSQSTVFDVELEKPLQRRSCI
jgi:hypothetical protein